MNAFRVVVVPISLRSYNVTCVARNCRMQFVFDMRIILLSRRTSLMSSIFPSPTMSYRLLFVYPM